MRVKLSVASSCGRLGMDVLHLSGLTVHLQQRGGLPLILLRSQEFRVLVLRLFQLNLDHSLL